MIDLCFLDDERASRARPLNRRDLITDLESRGVVFNLVDRPRSHRPCLLFGGLDSPKFLSLSVAERSGVVLIADGDVPTADEAEHTRAEFGLAGLVDADAWRKWQAGVYVAWGLFGRGDVAKVAGLVSVGIAGLQPNNETASLPVALARFLLATPDHH